MRIMLFVEESAGIQAIRAVSQSQHEVVAVLTTENQKSGVRPGATVSGTAEHFGYPVWPAERVKESSFAETVQAERVDMILNVHSLHVVHKDVLDAVRFGAFNLHPGPLPEYAGMNSPNWAILHGKAQHGVTLHWMEAGIDTGAVAYRSMFDLAPGDTGLTVSSKCTRIGMGLVKRLLDSHPDSIPKIPQDLALRRYFGFGRPFQGVIPWHSASLIERLVRASNFHPLPSPWGTPRVRWMGEEIGLIEVIQTDRKSTAEAGTLAQNQGQWFLAAEDYWLELTRIAYRGKVARPEDTQEFASKELAPIS